MIRKEDESGLCDAGLDPNEQHILKIKCLNFDFCLVKKKTTTSTDGTESVN